MSDADYKTANAAEIQILQRQVSALKAQLLEYSRHAPPGHYYSPLPSREDINNAMRSAPQPLPAEIGAVKLDARRQVAMLKRLARLVEDLPWNAEPQAGLRYRFNNTGFEHSDAVALYGMLRWARPAQLIEVGSGFSSALILDVNQRCLAGTLRFTVIDPFPNRLLSLLKDGERERFTLRIEKLQNVPLDLFRTLRGGDILFVDSSHVAKFQSDVNYIVFEILPILQRGVLVHFHDVFYPFEYPLQWLQNGYAWNEAYLLRAFLQYNRAWEILFFCSYLVRCHAAALEGTKFAEFPNGGSIWLRKRSSH